MTADRPLVSTQNSGRPSPFDAIRRTDEYGDFWDGRDLMPLLDYDRWENFAEVIEKARVAIAAAGGEPDAHASRRHEASGRTRRANYRLTRYGAYITAMVGDVRKTAVGEALTYFAVKTREAETAPAVPAIPQTMSQALRLAADQYDRAVAAEQKVAELAPAADSWNTLAQAEGDFLVADAAKILSRDPSITIGQNRLFSRLGELGWIYRAPGDQKWRTKQSAIESGWLSEIPMTHYHPRTGQLVLDPPQIRVTVKGMHWLHRAFRSEAA